MRRDFARNLIDDGARWWVFVLLRSRVLVANVVADANELGLFVRAGEQDNSAPATSASGISAGFGASTWSTNMNLPGLLAGRSTASSSWSLVGSSAEPT